MTKSTLKRKQKAAFYEFFNFFLNKNHEIYHIIVFFLRWTPLWAISEGHLVRILNHREKIKCVTYMVIKAFLEAHYHGLMSCMLKFFLNHVRPGIVSVEISQKSSERRILISPNCQLYMHRTYKYVQNNKQKPKMVKLRSKCNLAGWRKA